ncbi:MAG: hypothetical protein KTR15_09520 [Phycisphaeraceae bacterium]|nr:hypothetical protein [Phycisphaeraceae bacterium]
MSDAIRFRCKACEKKISVRAEYAGKKVKCPGCKQPLRVPSPRPKRSSTGVPIAAGAAVGDGGPSSVGEKSYSLADLAEMEANANAEIKELSHKAANRPNSIRIEGGKDCPECGSSCKPDAVLCVHCGHNFESGKKLRTKKDSKLGNAVRSVASAVSEEDDDGQSDFWKYAVPTFGFLTVAILCFVGVAGKITEGIPLEIADSIHGTYESMGPAGAGGFFLVLAAISGGIWWFMRR